MNTEISIIKEVNYQLKLNKNGNLGGQINFGLLCSKKCPKFVGRCLHSFTPRMAFIDECPFNSNSITIY
jgi:hypothetical protein